MNCILLHNIVQTSYRFNHSNETSLFKVHYDVVNALENDSCAVTHAFMWFKCYLVDRCIEKSNKTITALIRGMSNRNVYL